MGFTSSLVAISALAVGAFAAPAAEPIDVSKLVKRAQAPNYNQDYIASGANVQYSPNVAAGTFSVNYNTQADFVVGLGWTTGDTTPITYSGTFSASGVGLLSIYGWSTNPLVEYYIMEDPIGYPKQGTQKGTVVCDGATYDIWEHQQVNQPSIQGTSTFNQYISIRESPRTSGTVTLSCHFNAWAALGMKLGTMNYQTLSVESWSGSGKGSFTVSKGAATGGGSGGTPTSSAAAAPTSPASGGGSSSGGAAQWGQCGGIGWTGPTTCVSPYTCKVSNSYYSQCQ